MKEIFKFKEFDLNSEGNTLALFGKRLLFVAGLFFIPLYIGILALAIKTMPYAGYLLFALTLAYLPLYFKRGKPTVKINDSFKVNYTKANGLNTELLKRSLGSVLLFSTMLIAVYIFLGDYFGRQ